MLRIGLTGGIGSGKSTVSERLAELGAEIIDADTLAREVVAPGSAGLREVVERFGSGVLAPDGSLDRAALGRIVFSDDQARRDLEAITHPRVAQRTAELFAAARPDAIVVHDIPLLVELGRGAEYHLVVVVHAPEEVRAERLTGIRGMAPKDARSRIASQATDAQRRAAADVWLDNSTDVPRLIAQVDALWQERLRPYAENLAAQVPARRRQEATLVPADPEWRSQAARATRRIRYAVERAGAGELVVGCDHIGSTAVPGLPAKDVLDLQVRVRDEAAWEDPRLLEGLGWAGLIRRRKGDVDDIHPWAPSPDEWRKDFYLGCDPGRIVHVHVRVHDSEGARTALLFRDWLRRHPAERESYGEAKEAAARTNGHLAPGSPDDYTATKAPWIAAALLRARAWAAAVSWRGPSALPSQRRGVSD